MYLEEVVKIVRKATMLTKQDVLLDILKEKGPKTRMQLVRITKFKRTTVYDNLSKLELENKIEKKTRINGQSRPIILWKFID